MSPEQADPAPPTVATALQAEVKEEGVWVQLTQVTYGKEYVSTIHGIKQQPPGPGICTYCGCEDVGYDPRYCLSLDFHLVVDTFYG